MSGSGAPARPSETEALALIPDPATGKAGRDLATPNRWKMLGAGQGAIWGECQGSAKTPYQTGIDLRVPESPAYKCSCPSRKFPCKHGAALILLYAAMSFPAADPPDWMAAWLAGRAEKAESKRKRPAEAGAPPEPALKPAKAVAAREAKVTAGLEDLSLWLHDLMRRGLAHAAEQPDSFWDVPIRRLIDAQASGAAGYVGALATVVRGRSAYWPQRALDIIGRLHLLIAAYARLESLPPEVQADVRRAIGWTERQEAILNGPSVRDTWLLVAHDEERLDNLMARRIWLLGYETGRAALLLAFRPTNVQGADYGAPPVVGPCFEGELAYYPGAYPLRALFKSRTGGTFLPDAFPVAYRTLSEALAAYATALAAHPWLDRFPMPVQNVIPIPHDGGWQICDEEGHALPVASEMPYWEALAVSGGHPITVFAEWDGSALTLHAAWADGQLSYLRGPLRFG